MTPVHQELLEQMRRAIKDTAAGTVAQNRICVAFSGGVDSALLAKLCSEVCDTVLITVGFAGSHDIEFAPKVASQMNLACHTRIIDKESFDTVAARVQDAVKKQSISWIENCIAFCYAAEEAKSLGISMLATANGIDELFCGYDAYRKVFDFGAQAILRTIEEKIENELQMMDRIQSAVAIYDVKMAQPFLSANFVKYAKGVPVQHKIKGSDDMMRKHIIRSMAFEIGVPEISYTKRKKALQYGTKIHKELIKRGA